MKKTENRIHSEIQHFNEIGRHLGNRDGRHVVDQHHDPPAAPALHLQEEPFHSVESPSQDADTGAFTQVDFLGLQVDQPVVTGTAYPDELFHLRVGHHDFTGHPVHPAHQVLQKCSGLLEHFQAGIRCMHEEQVAHRRYIQARLVSPDGTHFVTHGHKAFNPLAVQHVLYLQHPVVRHTHGVPAHRFTNYQPLIFNIFRSFFTLHISGRHIPPAPRITCILL